MSIALTPLPDNISELFRQSPSLPQVPALARPLLTPWLQQQRTAIADEFRTHRKGKTTAEAYTTLADTLILGILRGILPTPIPQFAILATGGYGRRMMAPYSDIDLLFLFEGEDEATLKPLVECLLYCLWDQGFKVGHATRSIENCLKLAREDLSIFTSLLDARFLHGDAAYAQRFQDQFFKKAIQGREAEFIRQRLQERDQRHNTCGDSRYILEPNIKEGKGGLRDLQTLFWLAKVACHLQRSIDMREQHILTPQEYQQFKQAREFLWQTRIGMHLISQNGTNRLTFDIQRELAHMLGYEDRPGLLGVERFMKGYFLAVRTVGDLTRSLCTTLEQRTTDKSAFSSLPNLLRRRRTVEGLPLKGSRLTIASADWLREDPSRLLQFFAIAQSHHLDIHPEALQLISRNLSLITPAFRRDPAPNRLFLRILTHPHQPGVTLRRLSESGVLGRFLPDFGRIIGMMQFDMYHIYTVDEHTLQAISILNSIEKGELKEALPLASDVIHRVQLRNALFLGLLLHDIAKGRGGNHSELGEQIARKLGRQLGLPTPEIETTAWLVRHHLIFSDTAFRRDLSDPGTIRRFVDMVQSPERLKLLLLLTVADIRAVGPSVWNSWKGTLMRELYNRAAEAMGGGGFLADRESRMQQIKRTLSDSLTHWPARLREQYLRPNHASFWLGMSLQEHQNLAELLHQTMQNDDPFALAFTQQPEQGLTRLSLCTISQHGLFMQVAGACAASSVQVVTAKSFTTSLGYSILLFDVQNHQREPITSPRKQQELTQTIRHALGAPLKQALFTPRPNPYRKSSHVFHVKPQVLIDNSTSRNHTIVEINARDRLGLLYTIARTLTLEGLMISTAHVSTYGEKAIDVFYIKDMIGTKITQQERLENLRQQLLDTLGEADARLETTS